MFFLNKPMFIFFIYTSSLCFFTQNSFAKSLDNKNSLSKKASLSKEQKKAVVFLKKVLDKYKKQSIHFVVQKEFSLLVINKTIHESGALYVQNKKFRILMNGEPAYLMLFDGEYLWYQADLKEKIVFKLKNHPHIYLLFAVFDSDNFFKYFKIKNFKQKSKNVYRFDLLSKGQVQGVKTVSLTVGNYIQEILIVWEDLDQWQKYKFLKPWVRQSFPKSKFQFSQKNFEVISKKDF